MKNFFEWLKNKFAPKADFFPGVIDDPSFDIKSTHSFHEVVAASAAPVWVEKKPEEWRQFPSQFQARSSSCVWFTVAKITMILFFLRVNRIVRFSAGLYRKRKNFPGEGTGFDDAVHVASKGVPTEEILPSENLNEQQMNKLVIEDWIQDSADAFALPPDWVRLPMDFDVIAATLNKTNKGIMVWFEFGKGEFFDQGIPVHKNVPRIYRHSVTAIDNFLYNNVQYILIEDSAETDTKYKHQKLISREFFNRHAFLAAYPVSFKFDYLAQKPIYDGGVVSLQNCLKYEGVFPSNVDSTGIFGSVTREAVMKFQLKYGLEPVGTVGPKTTQLLKELYG